MPFGRMGARGGFGGIGLVGGSGVPPLAFPQPFAVIGDSIPWAQSTLANNSICQIGQWINGFSGGRTKLVQNFNKGVGGQTIAQIAARFTTDISPLGVKIVLVNGDINSYSASVSAASALTSWDSIISQAAALGIYLIILPALPTSSLTAPQETQRLLGVAGLNARASSHVRVIDITGYDNTTLDYAQQGTGVRIHPNIVGAQLLGQKAAAIAATIVKPGNGGLLTASDPLNHATNGYLTGTGGSLAALGTGVLADNLTIVTNTAKGNMLLACSKVARPAGGFWQRGVLSGTYIFGSNDLGIQSQHALTGFAADDKMVVSMDMQVASGAVNVNGLLIFMLLFEVGFTTNVSSQAFYVNTTEHQGGFGTPASNYILQSEPFNLAAGKVPGFMDITVIPNLDQDAGAGAACALDFQFGAQAISKYT